ncbi:integrator complex subunit 7 [Onthophagus taurus]|uniref:integrator complex subunit 7 n=1 Tax=Onthophagus taurus TaxID=166361 RepID=UPI000C1FE9A6|nr:integrator complex subunit 7 [Onthophagus taurus]
MLGVRVNIFIDNSLGEPEQDANSALTELDKGLRSGKVGEQCEAIVRFPRLFEKYPFPILINASLLKLADVFRVGNNFLRMCVLRVCQQSEKHLDKISNVDEFVKRIFSVIHSNDPIARALTLRTLGAVAGIIPERQQVHHSIRSSLDSHDNVEIEAAICAATQFAAQSKTFAISMCNKISNMIQGQSTPASMKLELIPILQYMYHDTHTAAMVRKLATDLLPGYPAEDFVQVILTTLTKLAATTLVDIPSQVELLLEYLHEDSRFQIKSSVLQQLYELAKPGAHLWPPGAVDSIIDMAYTTESPRILRLSLRVIKVLVESPLICAQHQDPDSKLRKLCLNMSLSSRICLAVQAIQILTQILCYGFVENSQVSGTNDVIQALESLILLLTQSEDKNQLELKLTLKCAVRLCEYKLDYCEKFLQLLGSRLGSVDSSFSITICESLGAIGSLQPEALLILIEDILKHLSTLSKVNNPTSKQSLTKVMLCTLIFQSMCGYKWRMDVELAIKEVTNNNNINLWANYRIGRAAMRYGHHKAALSIFEDLTEQVSSEHLHFWLVCLKEICTAESELIQNNPEDCDDEEKTLVDRLSFAVVHYNKAIAALKAATTPSNHLHFQAEYMRIRSEFLQCLIQVIHTCNILCVVPPPAIASTLAQTTRDEFMRHGYLTNQMRKCVKEFQNCSEMYWGLYQTAFDADPSTLENLQILQQMCVLFEQCVENISINTSLSKPEILDFVSKNTRLECKQLIQGCKIATEIAGGICKKDSPQTITHKHANILRTIANVLSNTTLPIPRFFFQILQSTTIKLSVSPQPRVMGEFISIQFGSQLAVKVEGVVQHAQKPGLFRKVDGVVVSISTQLQTNTKNKDSSNVSDTKANLETISTVLQQTVTPHKDFFTAQFLLAFPKGGQYVLSIEASIVDEVGNVWKTGPRSTLTVKVPEEIKNTPISMPGMAGTANVILMPEDNHFIKPGQKK